MYFHFCFSFFSQYSYRNYECCSRIKNLIVLLAKTKSNYIEVFISKTLIESNISEIYNKLRFIREQEANGFTSLGIKTPFIKISLLGDILFKDKK